jgi:exonuclease III
VKDNALKTIRRSGLPRLAVGSWNVKGLTDEKLYSICMIMKQYRIDVVCLQETWAVRAEYYLEGGFHIILSGTEEVGRSWAGVSFLVAPWCRHRIHGFYNILTD